MSICARPIALPLLLVLVASGLALGACGGSAPPRTTAEIRSELAGPVVLDDLVEYGRTLLLRTGPKGEGILTIDADLIEWVNEDESERSFSIQPKIVRNVRLHCAERRGQNVCLELFIDTVTDRTYRFRDRGWESGENAQIRRAYEEMRRRFPDARFEEREVDEVD